MMGKGRGGGKTPERVVELLRKAVAEKSQSAVARESGLALLTVQRYLKGIGEPTTETLIKIGKWSGKTVYWLRGDKGPLFVELSKDFGMAKAFCAQCGEELFEEAPMIVDHEGNYVDRYTDGIPRFWPCDTCCKKEGA